MKQDIFQLLMFISMLVAIGLLAFTIIVLIKNAEEIRTDGVTYAINKYNFSSCTCYTQEGKSVDFNSNGSIPKIFKRENYYSNNWSELKMKFD